MNENEKPALGSAEAAVLTVVELIARAASMSEQHVSYWLDLYYQVRSRYEFENSLNFDNLIIKKEEPDPVMARLDELEKKIDELKNGVTLKMNVRPVHPAPYRTAEDVIRIRPEDLAVDQDPAAAFIKQFAEADDGDTSSDAARHSDAGDARAGDDQAAGARKEREPQRGRQTAKGPGTRVQDARSRPPQRSQDARRQDRGYRDSVLRQCAGRRRFDDPRRRIQTDRRLSRAGRCT